MMTETDNNLNKDQSTIATRISKRSDFEQADDEKTFAMLAHLTAFTAYFTGIGIIVGPLVVWLIKKDQSEYVNHHGKESLNFQITALICFAIGCILIPIFGIGLIILALVKLAWIILIIIASIKAKEGSLYRYPCILRFIK